MTNEETFPKRYEPAAVEAKCQNFWYSKNIYRYEEKSAKPTFSIDTPPPTISGRLHIGHVFSYTHTEITSRYRRMQGLNVYYPFGYDDNGLPTEILTEKEFGIKAYQTDRAKFRELCLQAGAKYSELFSTLWKQMGFSCDFESAYSTISPSSQRIAQWSFIDLYSKGRLDRRKEPALWCTSDVTSFAQAEIDDVNKAGRYLHLPFEVEGMPPIVIATTRPEMLAACVALFVNPEDDRFRAYWGKKARVPFYDFEVSVLTDEKAQRDKGTGAVMCCTFGDTTDIVWWRQHKLDLREAIDKTGKMTALTGPLTGLKIEAAKTKITELLKEKNLVLKVVEIPAETRVVNTHDRCGTPVEYLVQPQWFIKVCDQKEKLIEFGKKVAWHPESMRYRYENWVNNLSWDWGISRQRSFGVPIPAWYSEDGSEIYVAKLEDLPVDPSLSQPKGAPTPKSGGKWIGDTDVMDTWATSSVSPLINAKYTLPDARPKDFLPMSMRAQAHDIIRTWAFYTIAKSAFHFDDIPWKDAVISGHVTKPGGSAAQGPQIEGQAFVKKTKISKSKDGDAFSPEKILEKHSADSIRLWSAAASLGVDIVFDEAGIQEAAKFLNKLWNASRFAIMQLQGFTPKKGEANRSKNASDLQTSGRLKNVIKNYHENLELYENHKAKVDLDKFFWETCDDYIELVKYRCQPEHEPKDKEEAQASIYQTIFQLLLLYAPYAPHITEEIYQIYFKQFENEESIHLLRQPVSQAQSTDEAAAVKAWSEQGGGRDALGALRKIKKEKNISYRTRLKKIEVLTKSKAQTDAIELFAKDIAGFAFADNISVQEAASAKTFQEVPLTFALKTEDLEIRITVDEASHTEQTTKKI